VAIAAQRLLDGGLQRVLVLDIDCHHGNGTQDIFYSSPDVFYISLHQDPRTLFPGSGFTHETGRGDGVGFTANVPLPPGAGDADFSWAFDTVFGKVYGSFRPDAVLVSVGLDAHINDPLTSLEVTIPTYRHITRELVRRTRKLAFFLEGGYDLGAMGNGVAAIVAECLDKHEDDTEDPAQASPGPRVKETVEELLEQLD
jgi:acetoin utilization deacetylase AcuC-like enzyme